MTVVIDGVLCDGGNNNPQGWLMFHPSIDDVNVAKYLYVNADLVAHLRIYNKALTTTECIGNWRAGLTTQQ